MSITVVFQTFGIPAGVDNVNLYRVRAGVQSRIAQLPLVSQYTDPTGQVGDIYTYSWFNSTNFSESGYSPFIIATNAIDAVTISGYLEGIDSLPTGTGVQIDIELQSPTTQLPTSDGQIIADMKQSVLVDANGIFVFAAIPTDKIFPSGTWYKITVLGKRYFKSISSTNGSSQLFSNLLDVLPFQLR